jgi:hypothetical protein
MEGIPEIACSVCKNAGHHPNNCPELSDPLNPGFYSGQGQGGGGGGEEDD